MSMAFVASLRTASISEAVRDSPIVSFGLSA